ncbi:hypothetical protein B5K11_11685 [Rhizobium leguminosarum bv. trifolii]|nr:hypothetical protein B5K11_11685 [Rhizobium leguminosarum bv. trifolii]
MGRKPLSKTSKTKYTAVRLTEEVRKRIEALVGPNRMALFIREAIEGELDRRQQAKGEDLPK